MLSFRIFVALGKTKIDNVDIVLGVGVAADKEVVWLDVTVNYALFMDFLDSQDLQKFTTDNHRIRYISHHCSFKRFKN